MKRLSIALVVLAAIFIGVVFGDYVTERHTDNFIFYWGTDNDWSMYCDTANILEFDPGTAGNEIRFGTSATDAVDLTWYSDTSGDTVIFDEENVRVQFEDVSLRMMDDTTIILGDDSDVTLQYDETTDNNFEIAADSVGMSISTNDFITTTDGAAANQFKVDATGTVAGYSIVLETTDSGVQINADGASNGDIAIDAADDMTITAGGNLTLAVTGTYSLGGAAVTNIYRTVELVTSATNGLTAAESGKIVVSSYTGTQTHTLPAAAAGLWFTFIDGSSTAADDVEIDPASGDQIDNDTAGDAIESVTDAYPQSITLIAVDGTDWHTVSKVGTWGAQ